MTTTRTLSNVPSDLINNEGKILSVANSELVWADRISSIDDSIKNSNKQTAISLLQETDWVEYPSVRNSENSPSLQNYLEFDEYRLQIRSIAINPPVDIEKWPNKPKEIWS